MNWNDIFHYQEGEIYWKTKNSQHQVGDRAGGLTSDGYLRVWANGRSHKVHRIIWEMHNGPIPEGMEVDHIDHNRLNNAIENLRLVTHRGNAVNQSLRSTNKSGLNGISWDKARNKWVARIYDHGKQIPLGRYSNIDDAIAARKEAELRYGYFENHGK